MVTEGGTATGDFRGIGPGFVRFLQAGLPDLSIKTHRLVTLADAAGHSVSGEAIDKLLAERRLPTLTGLMIETAGSNQVVDHADVAGVSRLSQPHSGKLTGALIGLLVDAALVVAVAADSGSGYSDTSCSTCSSCPLIDSFDGREWVLDAEPLGGAFYRAAERTDVARLERLVETDGRYLLRIRNDQQEIDHLNAVALRVLDHPRGTEVVPDALGQLHAVRQIQAPTTGRALSAVGLTGGNGRVAALVAAADGEAWVSDGPGLDPSLPGELRDGIELQYPRPRGAESALLVARVGATALGPRVLSEVLALQGRDLGLFYASLEAQPSAREAFERAREREVLPTVRVFDGTGWRVAGYLRDLPSLVRREQAVPLDLRGVDAETLRLRIDGAPGLFSIDRAVVSFDSKTEVAQTRVLATAAADDAGRDVLDAAARRRRTPPLAAARPRHADARVRRAPASARPGAHGAGRGDRVLQRDRAAGRRAAAGGLPPAGGRARRRRPLRARAPARAGRLLTVSRRPLVASSARTAGSARFRGRDMTIRARHSGGAVSWPGLALALAGCGFRALTPQLYPADAVPRPGKQNTVLKVHMKSGELYTLVNWRAAPDGSRVEGTGTRYTIARVARETRPVSIATSDVALFETNTSQDVHPGGAVVLAIWSTITGGAAVYCLADPKACFGSCPTFYLDGADPDGRPAAEGFSSSIARALEARDVDAIGGFPAGGGGFAVTMRNEAFETHAVRRVRLVVAERPPGGRVLAGPGGSYYPTSEPRAPRSCRAAEGDCLAAVAAADGVERSSPADTHDLATRETVELDFGSPAAGGEQAAGGGRFGLVVGARQTLLSTHLFYQTMAYSARRRRVPGEPRARRPGAATRMMGMARVLGGIEVEVAEGEAPGRIGSFDEAGPIAGDARSPVGGAPPALCGSVSAWRRATGGSTRSRSVALGAGRSAGDRPEPCRAGRSPTRARSSSSEGGVIWSRLPGHAYRITFTLPPSRDRAGAVPRERGLLLRVDARGVDPRGGLRDGGARLPIRPRRCDGWRGRSRSARPGWSRRSGPAVSAGEVPDVRSDTRPLAFPAPRGPPSARVARRAPAGARLRHHEHGRRHAGRRAHGHARDGAREGAGQGRAARGGEGPALRPRRGRRARDPARRGERGPREAPRLREVEGLRLVPHRWSRHRRCAHGRLQRRKRRLRGGRLDHSRALAGHRRA